MYPFKGACPSSHCGGNSCAFGSPGAQRSLVQSKDPRRWISKRQQLGFASLFKTHIPNYCLTLTSTNIGRGVFGQGEAKSLRTTFDNKDNETSIYSSTLLLIEPPQNIIKVHLTHPILPSQTGQKNSYI